MVHAYYNSLHDSIASVCKTLLPNKRRRIATAESENLKWQQESFHKILNLMGLCKEGIVPESDVSAFRTHLLRTLILQHHPTRDKLVFLQELLYGKCISEEEYHASKRPLLQRLAVQGDATDVIVEEAHREASNEEWSVIDLKDVSTIKNKSKEGSTLKRMKGAVSLLGFDGLKKWRKNDPEAETAPFPSINDQTEEESYDGKLIANPFGEGPDTIQIKRRVHPDGAPTDFFVDKVLAENIKKRLSQLAAENTDIHLKDDEIQAISTRLPVDKEDLIKCFPESWCDQFGDIVIDVVRKEFKLHMREMGNRRRRPKDNKSLHPNKESDI